METDTIRVLLRQLTEIETDKIGALLKQLISDLHYGRKSIRQAASGLAALPASVMAEAESFGNQNDLNQAMYWDLLNSVDENGFETEPEVFEYFWECLEGRRNYSPEDIRSYFEDKWKTQGTG